MDDNACATCKGSGAVQRWTREGADVFFNIEACPTCRGDLPIPVETVCRIFGFDPPPARESSPGFNPPPPGEPWDGRPYDAGELPGDPWGDDP